MPSFHEVFTGLGALPVDLAHQIIGDLIVYDALKLFCYGDPNVAAAVKSHPHYRILLGDNETKYLQTKNLVTSLVGLHRQWGFFSRADGSPDYRSLTGPLAMNAQSISFDALRRWITFGITRDLESPIKAFLLEQFLATPLDRYVDRSVHPDGVPNPHDCKTVEELERCIAAIQHARNRMIQRSTDQLYCAAKMLENNSDILKRTLDPEQKRRANIAHVVDRMRKTGDKIKSRDYRKFTANEHFRYDFFPVIPFDSALIDLLRNLETHGLVPGQESPLPSDKEEVPQTSHSPFIMNQVDILIEGLPHFFTEVPTVATKKTKTIRPPVTNDEGDVFRTKNTPWSEHNDRPIDSPYFTVHRVAPSFAFKRQTGSRAVAPCDDKEERWLTSFVELYRYLEELERTTPVAA